MIEFSSGAQLFGSSPIFFAITWASGKAWFWLVWVWLWYFLQVVMMNIFRPALLYFMPGLPLLAFDMRAHKPDAGWFFGTRMPAENSPADTVAMVTVGRATGTIHASNFTRARLAGSERRKGRRRLMRSISGQSSLSRPTAPAQRAASGCSSQAIWKASQRAANLRG